MGIPAILLFARWGFVLRYDAKPPGLASVEYCRVLAFQAECAGGYFSPRWAGV
jgi:hypothetical protein